MKKILLLSDMLFSAINLNVFAEGDDPTSPTTPGDRGDGGSNTCTVTSNCFNFAGTVMGSVSCTGTECTRGGGWVKCNGKTTKC